MKKAILFVDDDDNIIKGLKRIMRAKRSKWDMFFVESGEAALRILSQTSIAVIVADIRMPGMDGVELLHKIRGYYPQVIRIVLSGHSSRENNLRLAKLAHQYFTKPCDINDLKNCIEYFCSLEERFLKKNKEVAKVINSIQVLPILPGLHDLLVRELKSPVASLKKISGIVAQDILMSAKILQLANSAFFALDQKTAFPDQAVTILGLEFIKELVLGAKIFSSFPENPNHEGFFLYQLWKHSMMVGTAAKEIALNEPSGVKFADEAFVAGMLHDVGKILLREVPGFFQQFREFICEKRCSHLAAEKELLGVTHAGAGAYFLGLWNIPDDIVEAVAYHHCPGKVEERRFSVLTCLHAANGLIDRGEGVSGNMVFDRCLDMQYIRELGLENKLGKWLDLCGEVKKKMLHQPEAFS